MAWAMVTRSRSTRNLLLLFIALPFLMNLIIRVYAIRLFFGFDGPAVHLSSALGLGIDPFAFSQNIYLVVYGMVTSYLPFMLFPLYVGLEKFDFQLIEASNDLGCSPAGSLFKIVIPNATRPMINGCILVFIPSLGEFVIPDLLGGAKTMLAGNLITEQFLKARDWPFGSVLALCLIAFLLLALWGFHRIERGVHARARTP
jgi:spermidine/putrescine transport system permease protein